MDMDLRAYVKVYPSWIEAEKLKPILSDLSRARWEKHTFYQPNSDSHVSLSGDNELDITGDFTPNTPYVMQRIWDALNKYIMDDFNFSWFNGWAGYSNVRFNRYSANQQMALHCDHISNLFDGKRKGIPTLTILGVLNDDYEGGEFVMWDEVLDLKAGDIVIFPSIFLYPHKVEPVVKGERYSFVSWAW